MNKIRKADRQLSSLISRIGHREDGFSMISAIMALMVGTLLSLAAWATAQSDIKFTDNDKWSRLAYQRAQSGISDYVQHLAEDSGFWKACDRPDGVTGNGIGQTALNDNDIGATDHPRRRWLPMSATAGTPEDLSYHAQYTIDLEPLTGTCKPSLTAADRMIDTSSGTFRVAVTGRAGPLVPANLTGDAIEAWRQNNWKRATIVAEFRRNGFLDYGYFTDHEGQDPALQTTLADPSVCDAFYQDTPGVPGRWRNTSCQEIQFADVDKLQGPFHTNDSVYLESFGVNNTSSAKFGKDNKADRIEVYDGNKNTCPFRDGPVTFNSSFVPSPSTDCTKSKTNLALATGANVVTGPAARYLDLPVSNEDMVTYADPDSGDENSRGYTFHGTTKITLLANNQFKVQSAGYAGGAEVTRDWPTSGVIYVDNNGVSSCTSKPITDKYPALTPGCALVEVSGTYNKSLTIGSESDIVITGDVKRGTSQTAVLGLIAQQYVRVRHYAQFSTDKNYGACTSSSNQYYDSVGMGTAPVRNVQAAVLALQHSFTVDGYRCGTNLGPLKFYGALAQRWRGTVGRGVSYSNGVCSGGNGYCKDYEYDYTFKSQTPPHFLTPSAATWKIIRLRQTVPACKCSYNE